VKFRRLDEELLFFFKYYIHDTVMYEGIYCDHIFILHYSKSYSCDCDNLYYSLSCDITGNTISSLKMKKKTLLEGLQEQ